MNIAICDDEPQDLNAALELLSVYAETTGASIRLSAYQNADALLASIESGAKFDLMFLDVLMPGFSGIHAARELRASDSAAELVFMTSSPDFALDAFSVRARDYLIKPLKKELLFRVMDDVGARLDDGEDLVIESRAGLRRIYPDRVEYCESRGHCLVWHMRSGALIDSKLTMEQAEQMLSRFPFFLRVHRSFLVNCQCVEAFDRPGCSVLLESMVSLPVPKAKFTQIQEQYRNYKEVSAK